MTPLFAFFGLESGWHWLLLAVIGILLFGKRLPEVGRSLGKGIVEFKKGLKGLEDEIEIQASAPSNKEPQSLEPPRPPQRVQTTVPKFEENPSNPQQPPTA